MNAKEGRAGRGGGNMHGNTKTRMSRQYETFGGDVVNVEEERAGQGGGNMHGNTETLKGSAGLISLSYNGNQIQVSVKEDDKNISWSD